ncbi:hypothetical protein BDN71DRAFT_1449834 [Pleurotus eryngii]|uniref:Uncharacterized protein n=1 Tax=Pleurotus eryngii TaxID=5323 RepID=A0A9P6D5S0_PLEER|nr:hypothetical protein BDN71DRAFT_1449834 [Pleurotus eryngii]
MSLKSTQYHPQSEHVINGVSVMGGNIREDDVEAFMLRWILGRWQVGSCSRVWNSDSQVGNSSTWTMKRLWTVTGNPVWSASAPHQDVWGKALVSVQQSKENNCVNGHNGTSKAALQRSQA